MTMKTLFMSAIAVIFGAIALSTTTTASAEPRFARAFEHINFGGRNLKIVEGKVWRARHDWTWNDRVSSIKVPKGCILSVRENGTIYPGRDLGALHRIEGRNLNLIFVRDSNGVNWNDRISLMLLRCKD